jgi:hypothetical protein
MERITMNQEDQDWLEWLKGVQEGVVTQRQGRRTDGSTSRPRTSIEN